LELLRSADPPIRRSADPPIRRSADPPIRRSADPLNTRPGDASHVHNADVRRESMKRRPMRRFLTVALLGLAVTAAATDASAQGRPRGRGPRGVVDTARARQTDSLRAARRDTALRRRGPDSLRQHRLDSLRAAGVLDTNRAGRGGPGFGRAGRGPGGPGMGPMSGRGGLMGIKLNENEKAAVKTITQKYRAEFDEFREANKGMRPGQNAQLDAQVKAIAEREQAEIRAALTAEHQAQFDANIAKRKQLAANRPPGRGPRPPALR
jgi:Spy/CpxP family protein refolding chaperone